MITVFIRPMVTYFATAWLDSIKFRTSKVELSKLQRMACLGIIGAMRTAKKAAIERSSVDSPHCTFSFRLRPNQ
jgi:hypothetical protein